ncbi:small integral membrane protein 8 [Aplysia californica]|uniref:Small integral membrane protein 8 n=1 Tax=Aplysia californica TaxID=6500 RepID=A0ABM0JPG8_APLCA|nr:small integral membrane protein 8 [Aplysia californica]
MGKGPVGKDFTGTSTTQTQQTHQTVGKDSEGIMSNQSQNNTAKHEPVKDAFKTRSPGWTQLPSTSLFRAVNFELFVKPNKVVMAFGIAAFTGCVSYIVYMNMNDDKKKTTYVTLDEDGGTTTRQRSSRWY